LLICRLDYFEQAVPMPFKAASRSPHLGAGSDIDALAASLDAVPFPISLIDESGRLRYRNMAFRNEWPSDEKAPETLATI
jgi:hypothetical protein